VQPIKVVTVTYGNRYHLLKKVIIGIMEQTHKVSQIIVVDNNSEKDSKQQLKELEQANPLVKAIYLNDNMGSAYGFKRGMQEAACCDDDCLIWLLDDDNMPNDNALAKLMIKWRTINVDNKNNIALLSLRDDRADYIYAAQNGHLPSQLIQKNGFLGFHVKDLPQKIYRKAITMINKKGNLKSKVFIDAVKVELAPYGGFFFSSKSLKEMGYPSEKFYLYSDDHEFTYRFTTCGGAIYLITASKIQDIDTSWYIKKQKSILPAHLESNNYFRIYYSVRNRVFFEKENMITNTFIYKLNSKIYLWYLTVLALLTHKQKNIRWIKRACCDGWSSRFSKIDRKDFL
jgi:GT2 family glycosyltransferase